MNIKAASATAGLNIVSLTAVIALYTAGVGAGFFQKVVFAGDLQVSEQRQQEYTDRRFMMFQLTDDITEISKTIITLSVQANHREEDGLDVTVDRVFIEELGVLRDKTEDRLEACKDPDKLCI